MPLIRTVRVAELLNVSPRTVHRMVDKGKLPVAHKLPGKTGDLLFDSDQIMEYLAAQLAAKGQKAS